MSQNENKNYRNINWALVASVLGLFVVGTFLFHFAEGWSYLDSLYCSVITLTTVGYGDFTPVTTLGKILSMIYILFGLGIMATFISNVGSRTIERREIRKEARREDK